MASPKFNSETSVWTGMRTWHLTPQSTCIPTNNPSGLPAFLTRRAQFWTSCLLFDFSFFSLSQACWPPSTGGRVVNSKKSCLCTVQGTLDPESFEHNPWYTKEGDKSNLEKKKKTLHFLKPDWHNYCLSKSQHTDLSDQKPVCPRVLPYFLSLCW